MTSKIADVLEILSDGRWYTLKEVQQKAKIDEAQLEWIMDFLTEYDFTVKDEAGKKVRLDKTVQEFLAKITTA
jgi:DNA-binding IclR family transcriptional regulator